MPSAKAQIRKAFPRLGVTDVKVTSDADQRYNCIAWAAGDTLNKWWPQQYWFSPPNVPREVTIGAFIQAFETVGFRVCAASNPTPGFEKLAIYTTADGRPTHAAFLLPNGMWASKLGTAQDIEHRAPHGLGGTSYGEPTHYMERPTPNPPRPVMTYTGR